MSKLHRLTLAGIATLALIGNAHATSSVVVGVTGLTFTINGSGSLNTWTSVDGGYSTYPTAKAFTTTSGIEFTSTGEAVAVDTDEDGYYNYHYSSGLHGTPSDGGLPTTPVTTSSASPSAESHSTLSASGILLDVSTGADGGMAYARGSIVYLFELAPNSSLSMSWSDSVVGSNSGDLSVLGYNDSAYGRVSASLTGWANGASESVDSRTTEATVDISDPFPFEVSDTDKTLIFQSGETYTHVKLIMTVEANTVDYALAVPEPGTWALTLEGLGAIAGLMLARRKRL